MDADEPVFSPRARRAAPLIAAALTVVIVGSLLYLRQAPQSPVSYKGPSTFPQLDGRYWPAFDFVTPSLGWAAIVDMGVDQVAVYRTTDGAKDWHRQFIATQPFPQSPRLHFFDSAHGWVYAGRLYVTSNAGSQWSRISIPDETANVTFPSPTKGWALDGLVLYATSDGGLTWRVVGQSPAAFYWAKGFGDFDFRAGGEGWGGGHGPTPIVYATFDGGSTWRSIPLPAIATAIPSPLPAGKGYAAGYSTAVLLVPGGGVIVEELGDYGPVDFFITLDRGATWQQIQPPPLPATGGDIDFIDSRHWWASRLGLIYKTSDAGRSWQTVRSTFPDGLDGWLVNSARMIDARHGWLVITAEPQRSRRSALLTTSDGGAHWSLVTVPRP